MAVSLPFKMGKISYKNYFNGYKITFIASFNVIHTGEKER